MLHDVNYYYQKARESGIADLNCRVNACLRNPFTKEIKSWPEVANYYQYIDKCYQIASEVPVEELRKEFYAAKHHSKKALEKIHLKVIDSLNDLNDRDVNHMMGYTPISHVREQLLELYSIIDVAIRNFKAVPAFTVSQKAPVRKGFFAKLFG